MVEREIGILQGQRVLIVEDEYIIAADMAQSLEDLGVSVMGPAGSVADALALIARSAAIDTAVLDVNLGAEKVYLVADALQARGVPVVFVTGYDDWIIPEEYACSPRLRKPVDTGALSRILGK
jgi:CheY-like chemotaxis protein